jgi:uncharacterized protein
MTIWAIADIHASATDPATGRPAKPMDVFGPQWHNHVDRLAEAWDDTVAMDDTVVIAGDTDWGLHLEDALETLARIASWKGRKILLRGNHDYWWSSKMTNRVRRAMPDSMSLLHNNAFQIEGFNICGAKGSPVPGGIDWTAENEKLLHRETQRLKMSLAGADPSLPTVAALHYPPFYPSQGTSPYRAVLESHNVVLCAYGHLHGGTGGGPVGDYGNIEYRLVAGDAVGFEPVALAQEGVILPDRQSRPAWRVP